MLHKFNYYWRVVATAVCFTVFGVGGLLLPLLVFPAQKLIYPDPEQRKSKARKAVHHTFKLFVGLMGFVGVAKFRAQDCEPLRNLRGHIIMANHPSLVDVVVLISMVPNANCVVKADLFKNPFMRGVILNTGYLSNANAADSLENCRQTLAAGNNLIIFPEGTRTIPGQALKFQRGAANIAVRCNAPVATILITTDPPFLTKHEKWYKVPVRRCDYKITLLENDIETPAADEDVPQSKIVRRFTRTLEQFFEEALHKI